MAETTPLVAEHELDNMPWFSLSGPQREYASFGPAGRAARMQRGIGYFCAMAGAEPEDWADMAALVTKGSVVLVQPDIPPPPPGWVEEGSGSMAQMVAAGPVEVPASADELEVIELGVDDVAEMVALVKATEPGPFGERTHELGRYIGVRREGDLVAMAGTRCVTPQWAEISAVCTAASERGRGLGTTLTALMVRHIRSEGREAMLNVATNNTSAISVYEALGFTTRCRSGFRSFRPPR